MLKNNRITQFEFKTNFFKDLPHNLEWQKSPVQVYPLETLAPRLKLPIQPIQPDYNFIVQLTEGSFQYQIGPDSFNVTAPAILFVTYGSINSLKSIDKPLEGHFILIENQVMTAIFQKEDALNLFTIQPLLELETDESNWIYQLVSLLYSELQHPTPQREICESLLQGIVYKILKLSEHNLRLTRSQQTAIRFKQLVHLHFKEQKNTLFYATELGISQNHLNRCVNKTFQKSCKEIMNEVAIIQAQMMLWDLSKSISEIGYELNFQDPSYFSRLFRKNVGITPTEYREKIMRDLS